MERLESESLSPKIDLALDAETYRWLHDKYERLLLNEEHRQTTYLGFFYVLQGVLVSIIAAAGVATHNFDLLTFLISAIAILGVLTSFVTWAVTSRTAIACDFWRSSLWILESETALSGPKMNGDLRRLSKPFLSFEETFKEDERRPDRSWKGHEGLMVPSLNAPYICKWVGILWGLAAILATVVYLVGIQFLQIPPP